MSERQERTDTQAQEVLQTSELTARLLRRLTVSPGVLDWRALRQFAARMAGGITQTLSLLDDLKTRYGIVDPSSIENPPLVMEQPWMVNINAFLTNHNSFSSTTNDTTNQLISSSSAPQSNSDQSPSSTGLLFNTLSLEPPPSSTDSTISTGRAPGGETNNPVESRDTNRQVQSHQLQPDLDEKASVPAGKFRVSRSRTRRTWEKHSAEVQDDARNPLLKPSVASNASVSTAAASTVPVAARIEAGNIEEENIDSAKVVAPPDTAPIKLPLARTRIAQSQIQSESLDKGAHGSRPPASEAGRPHAPAAASAELALVEPAQDAKTADSSPPMPVARKVVQRGTAKADVTTRASKTVAPTQTATTPLPLVQEQNASPPVQRRPPDFIWRKAVDVPTMKDFASANANAGSLQSLNRTAVGASSVQPNLSAHPRQKSQTFTPETPRRNDEAQAAPGISTERILRNISRKLLIERERRGY